VPTEVVPFIDTHVHYWDLQVKGMRWVWLEPGYTSHLHSWTTASARERLEILHSMDRFAGREFVAETQGAGVLGMVHAHAATPEGDPSDETAWLDALARLDGLPNAMIGKIDLADPDGPALLARHRGASERCSSVRDMNGPKGLDIDACEHSLRAAAELDFSVELRTQPENFDMLVDVARRHPDVTFVLSHASLPTERSEGSFELYRQQAARLADLPNWVCKISALCGGSDPEWTVDSIRPWAELCYSLFGPDRAMLGTNWPVDRLFGEYADVVGAYRQLFGGLSADEQHKLFHRNAERVYRISDVSND